MLTPYRFHLIAALAVIALCAYAFVFHTTTTTQDLAFATCLVLACGWAAHAGAWIARPRATSDIDLTRVGQSLIHIANSLDNQNTALTYIANNIDDIDTRAARAALEVEKLRTTLVGIRYTLRLDESKRLGLDGMIDACEKTIAWLLPAETADGELDDDDTPVRGEVARERPPVTH